MQNPSAQKTVGLAIEQNICLTNKKSTTELIKKIKYKLAKCGGRTNQSIIQTFEKKIAVL